MLRADYGRITSVIARFGRLLHGHLWRFRRFFLRFQISPDARQVRPGARDLFCTSVINRPRRPNSLLLHCGRLTTPKDASLPISVAILFPVAGFGIVALFEYFSRTKQ
jgi:hypothetical protein